MSERFPLPLRALHVFTLTSFAVAQPVLERLSKNKNFLQSAGIEPAALVGVMAFVCVVIPAALLLVEVAARAFGRLAPIRVHALIVATLLCVISLPIARRLIYLPAILELALALAATVAATHCYLNRPWASWFVSAASVGVIVFPCSFLLASPIRQFVFPPAAQAVSKLDVLHPQPVVFLVFDAFCGTTLMDESRAIDAARYPNFAALAQTSTWFRNASTVHPRTQYAAPALLTGRYPRGERKADDAEYPGNLFRILQATGQYRQVVFEPYTNLFPVEFDESAVSKLTPGEQLRLLWSCLAQIYLRDMLHTDWHLSLPEVPLEWFRIKAVRRSIATKCDGLVKYGWGHERMLQYRHFLNCLAQDERPTLYFQHVVLPHYPWCYYPSGSNYAYELDNTLAAEGLVNFGETWHDDEFAVAHGMQRYVLQAQLTDRLLGETIDRLKQAGLFDRSLIVAVADHGVAFRAGFSTRAPTEATADEILSIPLFIKTPFQHEGSTSDRNVEIVDVLPSILAVLGIRFPEAFDGGSVFEPQQPARKNKTLVLDDGSAMSRPANLDHGPALERMLKIVGSGRTPEKLYAIGPHPELIGKQVDQLPRDGGDARALTTLLVRSERVLRINEKRPVAGYLKGRIIEPPRVGAPIDLAVAVNGVIAAVSRTYTFEAGRSHWSALMPEERFRSGMNDIDVFAVHASSGGELRLRPVRVQEATSLYGK